MRVRMRVVVCVVCDWWCVCCFVAAEWMSGIEKQRPATKGEETETETPQDQTQSTAVRVRLLLRGEANRGRGGW